MWQALVERMESEFGGTLSSATDWAVSAAILISAAVACEITVEPLDDRLATCRLDEVDGRETAELKITARTAETKLDGNHRSSCSSKVPRKTASSRIAKGIGVKKRENSFRRRMARSCFGSKRNHCAFTYTA
jgi:hypothetical protein